MTTAEGKRTCEGLSKIFTPRPNTVLRPATTVLHGGGIALLSASPGIPTPAGRTEIRIETNILKIRTAELQNLEGVERVACATAGRRGPPYGAAPEAVVMVVAQRRP
jgi:hypothetical protein